MRHERTERASRRRLLSSSRGIARARDGQSVSGMRMDSEREANEQIATWTERTVP